MVHAVSPPEGKALSPRLRVASRDVVAVAVAQPITTPIPMPRMSFFNAFALRS